MPSEYFKEYFWHYPRVIITDIDTQMLVFDELIFFSETKKYLHELFRDSKEAESYFTAFQAYLVVGVAVQSICDKVNVVMKEMYKYIIEGNSVLNQKTKYQFQNEAAIEALKGIFEAFHETSLRNKKYGRFDVEAKPLSYDDKNLIIRLIYYKKDDFLAKYMKKAPPILSEKIIESNKITEITGDSNSMVVSLFNGQALLEVTPFSAQWIDQNNKV